MAEPVFPPASAAPPPERGNGMAIAGMVLGILAIVFFFTTLIDLVIGVLAIVFSVIGMRKASRVGVGKGMAITGLITGIIGIALALLMIFVIAVPAFKDYMKKSKATEAGLELNRIGKAAKRYFVDHSEFPKGVVGFTPAATCCGQSSRGGAVDNKCPVNAAVWNQGVWHDLEFSVDEPGNYGYSYESDGKSFVAKASGDLDCDGEPGVYELHGTIDAAGNADVTLIPPPPGKY